jgi:hypothetical protein
VRPEQNWPLHEAIQAGAGHVQFPKASLVFEMAGQGKIPNGHGSPAAAKSLVRAGPLCAIRQAVATYGYAAAIEVGRKGSDVWIEV